MKLSIEIADTLASMSFGLMGRQKLAKDCGMLFKFPSIREASFWGKDTYIPLDIAFIDNNNKILSIKNIVPMSTRSVRSDGLCTMAIETNAGFFRNNKIESGSTVEFTKDSSGKETYIIFKK